MDIHSTPDAAGVAIRADIRHIPLARLVPGSGNVRRLNATVGVSALADSIEAHGLLHNLTVRKGKKGKYEVVAGSRRLAALRLLAKEGRLGADADIPCNVRDGDGSELSLVENVQREAMHVADEILAYRDLAENGMTPETIAARFGQSVVTVRQRLKLANLSPRVLDELRSDALTVEQARALALSEDHAEQEAVWFDSPSYSRDPRSLRALLTRDHVRSTDRLARFVGLEAYEAAGGSLVRDLFGEDSSTFLTDRALLTRLATEALERAAEPLRSEGWGWVDTSLETSILYGGGFGRIYPQTRDLTEAEQEQMDALEAAIEEQQVRIEACGEEDPDFEAEERKLAERTERYTALRDATRTYDPQEAALAGCLVGFDHGGSLHVSRGLVKAEDRAALDKLRRGDISPSANDEGTEAETAVLPGYSAALVEELTAIRTAAMRVELASRPAVALAALLYPLVGRIFHAGYMSFGAAVEIHGQHRNLAASIKEPGKARALAAWEAMKEAWGDTLPRQAADLWTWLLEQPLDKLLDLLAFVTAANLNAVKAKHDQSRDRLDNAEQIATAVELYMGRYWTADASFLSRLSRAEIADLLAEAGCAPEVARTIGKSTKSDAVTEAEKQLYSKAWLPVELRTRSSPMASPDV